MAISKYFTQSFGLYRKTRTSSKTGVSETETLVQSFVGVLDKATTAYGFMGDRETFDFTDALFCPQSVDILEDDIVLYGTTKYDVVSVIDPMSRAHHLEILLKRRK